MDKAVVEGLTVMRAFAHGVSPDYQLETSPGQYNEAIFRGLDYALDEARKRGIRVLAKHFIPLPSTDKSKEGVNV